MIRQLNSKDLKNFIYFCQNRDKYSDFYITLNNKRLFLTDTKVAKKVFNDCLKSREKCLIKEENDIIKAVLLIIGYQDKSERKYIKILSKSSEDTRDLFRGLDWLSLKNLFIKCRNYNKNFVKYDKKKKRYKPSYFARKSGFRIIAEREREVLLKKEEWKYGFNKSS